MKFNTVITHMVQEHNNIKIIISIKILVWDKTTKIKAKKSSIC